MIRDKLMLSVCDKLQQILLREENLTLKKTVPICQAFEMANRIVMELQSSNTLVNKVTRSKEKLFKQSRLSNNNEYIDDYKFCGKSHKRELKIYFAYGKIFTYSVIEIVLKANVRHKGDKFMKQNVIMLLMIIFLMMIMMMMFI